MRGEDSPVIARLQEILDRVLAKEPDARYQRVEELRDDLRAVLREIDPHASQDIHFTGSVGSIPPRHRAGAGGALGKLPVGRVAAFVGVGVLLVALAFGAYKLFGGGGARAAPPRSTRSPSCPSRTSATTPAPSTSRTA